MKKWLLLWVAALLMLSLPACGGIPEEEYNQVCAQRDALQQELQEMQTSAQPEETVRVTLKGTFTAKIYALVSDASMELPEPGVAVAAVFQSPPFLMLTGEFTEQLEAVKSYVFEIKDQVMEIPLAEYEANLPDPEILYSEYIQLAGFREAVESDWGPDSVDLSYELCE